VDVAIAGGLTEARKITALCETHHIKLAAHNPLSPVTAAASLHLSLATSNFGVQEHVHLSLQSPLDEVFTTRPQPTDGRLAAPEAPGLGVEIDRAAARALTARPAALPQLRSADGAFTNW
jgi:galactonate dehydratase